MKINLGMFIGYFLCVAAVLAQDNNLEDSSIRKGKIIKETEVVEQPMNSSKVVSVVNTEESVNILDRQRAWYQISTEAKVMGWIKMLSVRFVGVAKRQGELGVGDLVSSISNTMPTVSSGVRGFDEEDLKKSKADLAQVKLLNDYTANKLSAEQFAKLGNLIVNEIKIKEEK